MNAPADDNRRRGLLRALAIILACVVVAALLSVDAVFVGLERLLLAAKPMIAAHPVLGAVVFVALAALSALLAFFSSALLVPAAVYTWGNALTAVLLWLGWLLGGVFAYGVGRAFRRPAGAKAVLRTGWAAHLPSAPESVGLSLVLLWQLVLPSEIPGYLCGYLGVRLRVYLAGLALGELPYAIGAVLLGESVVRRQTGSLVAIGVVAAVLGYVLSRRLHQRGLAGAIATREEG